MLRNTYSFISPIIFGFLFAVGPLKLWPFLIIPFLILEIIRIKKHRYGKIGFARVGLLLSIVTVAYFAPLKYLDRSVVPSELEIFANDHGSLLKGDLISIYLPAGYTKENLKLGKERMRLRDLIKEIELTTGISHRIGYCGTGANLLFGASPIGGISFASNK